MKLQDRLDVQSRGYTREGGKSRLASMGTSICSRILFFVAVLYRFRNAAAAQCSSSSSLVGFQADFEMVQHQLRGRLHIVDDCSFTVSFLALVDEYKLLKKGPHNAGLVL